MGEQSPDVTVVRRSVGARPATESDGPAVEGIRTTVGQALGGLRGAEQLVDRIQEGVGTHAPLQLVGTIDDVPVGLVCADTARIDGPEPVCRIEFLGVLPRARGVGVGAALLAGVRQWAAAHGAVALVSEALPGDRATKNFFEAHGLIAHRIEVRGPVAQGERAPR